MNAYLLMVHGVLFLFLVVILCYFMSQIQSIMSIKMLHKMKCFKDIINCRKGDKLAYVEACFKENPTRLLSALGIRPAKFNTFCCVCCTSGRGRNGTGMFPFLTENKGLLRFKCFSCGRCFGPVDFVMRCHPCKTRMFSPAALQYLVKLYEPEKDDVHDNVLPRVIYKSNYARTKGDVSDKCFSETFQKSIRYREMCVAWQQKQADALGLPFDALNRPDVGKAFVGVDGESATDGDLVFYNLVNGKPRALKVRHDPSVGSCETMYSIDYEHFAFCRTRVTANERGFRMGGYCNEVCFGHDTVTSQTGVVVVVEGQTDVLAVCAAAAECARCDITAIGRDSAYHLLRDVDLELVAGKKIIYCEDNDTAGQVRSQENIQLLRKYGCDVSLWRSFTPDCKDSREIYVKYGAYCLINSMINNENKY